MNASTNLIGGKAQSEDWDDTAILNSFETGIMSFRTKTQSKPQGTDNTCSSKSTAQSISKVSQPILSKRKSSLVEAAQHNEENVKRPHYADGTTGEHQPRIALHPTILAHSTDMDANSAASSSIRSGIDTTPSSSFVNDEALQSMLMAWYYSGYATGRYQALKEVEEATAAAAAAASSAATATTAPESAPSEDATELKDEILHSNNK